MLRIIAVLVVVFGVAVPLAAVAQVDGGGIDGGDIDAGRTGPDAATAPDADPGDFRPALDDDDGCDCATGGAGSGAGLGLIVVGVAVGLRRRR